ncbi:response regulator [candidate division WOR-3 bacterium]|uniref:Response regulator n=1 Tax=candidate division WOR-3 bacterium TaxID=2052148 RepID=A0A9D5KAE5_UNCW3|nr:response regulator [candidate division WOR-3 bacterium]MBD3364579.1 response regulator [candidate division WOR-3 bacterium]
MMNQTEARRVLVVDDDPHLLNLLDLRLSQEGFNVTIASSAQEALEKISEETPQLVIADIMMPGMDGYQLCERIRETEKLHNIPFVFLSALAETQDKVKGLRLGADDYLTKPFEFHELLARVEILLDRYKRYQETFEREAASEIATAGNIEDLGVIDLLQMLSFGQKTGEVHLEFNGQEGFLYLAQGKLIAASYRNKHGAAALPVLLSTSEGRFTVKLLKSLSVLPTIQQQTDEAIFEALRKLDEAERIKQELDPSQVPVIIGSEAPSDETETEIIKLTDGDRTIQDILDEASSSDLQLLTKMRDMIAAGSIKIRQDEPEVEQEGEVQVPESETQAFSLMVVGSNREARNSFIRAASGEDEPPSDDGRMVNFGRFKSGPYQLNLYGLPGEKRFAPLWQTFTQKVQGIILLVNPSQTEEVTNLKFAFSLLRPHIQGPAIVVNTDPTSQPVTLDDAGVKEYTCLPVDRAKAQAVLAEILAEFSK